MRSRSLKNILFRNHGKISGNFKGNQILLSNIIYEGNFEANHKGVHICIIQMRLLKK